MASEISVIKKDGRLTLLLLKLFSTLYLHGGKPSGCGKCLEDYYNQLKRTGYKKIIEMKDTKKTCVLKPGVHYVRKMARHYMDNMVTDEVALKLLSLGFIDESFFTKLPEGWGEKKEKAKVKSKQKPKERKKPIPKEEEKKETPEHPDIITE